MIRRWKCLDCDESGEEDRDAEKHTKTTSHSTMSGLIREDTDGKPGR